MKSTVDSSIQLIENNMIKLSQKALDDFYKSQSQKKAYEAVQNINNFEKLIIDEIQDN